LRKKYRSEMSVQEYMDGAFPSKACIKRAIDSMFEPNPDFHRFIKELKRREEVRKKMAIDYREEWEKFRVYYRGFQTTHNGQSISDLMNDWIKDTIESREKLMREYICEGMKTDIVGGSRQCHQVTIQIRGNIFGTVSISKDDFRNWLKKRMKGGK